MSIVYTIESVSTKLITTKFGVRTKYYFRANGSDFTTNFKNPKLSMGQQVTFNFTTSSYGNEVDPASIVLVGSAPVPAAVSSLPVPAAPAPRAAPTGTSNKGTFPIPALDGQRSIVRQNALTNARELVTEHQKLSFLKDKTMLLPTLDDAAVLIEHYARKFEAYTAGDIDLEAAKKEVAEKKAA